MQEILDRSRLTGEVLILPEDEESIHETIKKHSRDARLIIMGIPGEPKSGIAKFFTLDKVFFSRELKKFTDLPPLLFVKASRIMELVED
jgi:hypothetical protein